MPFLLVQMVAVVEINYFDNSWHVWAVAGEAENIVGEMKIARLWLQTRK